jgi:hypothetical protein
MRSVGSPGARWMTAKLTRVIPKRVGIIIRTRVRVYLSIGRGKIFLGGSKNFKEGLDRKFLVFIVNFERQTAYI